ncbi:pectate lyase family protein [Saccharothrix yanglingensis]|uniref:pectate lyase family protein n=1 Tax=Saccharothrix yanglingensis TaxID=659496 RepID=UPI0027D2C15E|nr:right-handed parallel beta-helix repeat-containing protein [Saccharothrix yanglingensis]
MRRTTALAIAATLIGGVTTAITATTPAAAAEASPIGFASVNALGQNGTTGGAGGATVTVSTASAFITAVKSSAPMTIRVNGTIPLSGMQDVASNKTITGVGTAGRITGGGLDVDGTSNVIIRNLTFTGAGDDAINITDGAHHVWVDHNDISGASDGALDVKRGSDYVTVSWNRFHDQTKNSLVGHSDGNGGQDRGKLRITYHHNLFDGTAERNPRVRFADPVHVFNNYYRNIRGTDSYGAATAMDAGVLVEGNYFDNVAAPTKIQIFESDPGRLVQRNNVFVNSGAPESDGTVVEPRTYYQYSVDDPNTVPASVSAGAGVGKLGNPTPDTTAPSAPSGLRATASTSSSITLGWTASTDDVGVTGYTVHRQGGAQVGTSSTPGFTATGLAANTDHTFYVVARDAAGNTSPASGTVTARTTDGPVPPTGGPVGFASVDALGQNGTTGGAGGPEVTVTNATDFIANIKADGPRVVRVQGLITLPAGMYDVSSDKTIIGVGSASGITGGGLNVGLPVSNATSPPADAVHNVIIRNMVFRGANDDSINVQMFSHHIWIDHNDLSAGKDGLIDIKRGSSYVTVSWNHTHNHTKNMLLGHDDGNGAQDIGYLKVTYHHNWFDKTPQRNPRVRFGNPVHVFNNYFFDNSDVGVACQAQAGCWVEGNHFDDVEEPMTTSYAGPKGNIVQKDNLFTGESGNPVVGGSVQDPRTYYQYTTDPAANVKALVTAGAGTGRI